MSVIIPTNKFQTPITKELLDQYPDEVSEQFMDYIDTVPLLKWMISEDRPRAKDLPRDEQGRIIVDITHPHILEDMDYFRPAAKFYEENGCYSLLRPNSNPNSEYGKWFHEEVRRCRDGYVRESDGEWIPGLMYFYMNYSPIMLNRKSEKSGIYLRQEGFPDFWEGIYYRYHYREQARRCGKHCMELARRGCSKSFSIASDMNHNLLLGENSENTKRITTILTAYLKEYLAAKDGTLSKFTPMVDFCAENTEFPRLMVKRSTSEMIWQMGYKNSNGNVKGSLNSVMAVAVKDDEGKIRGKRGFVFFEEMGSYPLFKEVWDNVRDSVKEGSHVFAQLVAVGCCCKGTVVYDEYGKPTNIEDVVLGDKLSGYDSIGTSSEEVTYIQEPAYKECVRIEAQKGVFLECSKDHPILVRSVSHNGTGFHVIFKRADEISVGDRIMTSRYIGKFGNVHEEHAYLLGALFGDGNYSTGSSPTLSAPTTEEFEYWKKHYDIGVSKYSKGEEFYAQIYIRGIKWLIRKYGWNGLSKDKKELPFNIFEWDKESLCNFLGGYFNADGNVQIVKNKHRSIKLTCKYEKTLILVKALLHKLGISSHILKEKKQERLLRSNVNKNIYKVGPSVSYVLYISNSRDIITFRNNIRLIAKNKQARLDSYAPPSQRNGVALYDNVRFLYREDFPKGKFFIGKKLSGMMSVTVTSVQDIGVQRIYNLTANTTHTYITNTVISSNTAGDKESDFSGIKTMLYNPDSYEVYALDNVYDRIGKGTDKFCYFFPSYISRAGCMDKDGNSDVVKAVLEILMERWTVKRGGDAASLLSRIAQMPITPAEAILKVKSSYFPVTMLTERIRQLDSNPHIYDDTYVGTLVDVGGRVEFRATDDIPIRKWPVDNIEQGALEIFAMPPEGNHSNRYIIGCLTPGQMVMTDSGLKKVQDVTLSDKLLNKDGEFVRIINLQRRKKQNELVYNIRLWDNVDGTELTGNHPVYAATPKKHWHNWKTHMKDGVPAMYYKYEFDFKRADELKVGDVVKCPVQYYDERPVPEDKWVRESKKGMPFIDSPLRKWKFWWLMGIILGDGWCHDKGTITVCFNKKEQQYINRFKDAIKELFGKNGSVGHDRGSCIEFVFQCKQCATFFTTWFGKYAEHKHISEWIKYLPKPLRLALITGYLDSDGCCCKNSMEFVSISKKLLLDIQDILLSLGVVSGVKKLRDSTMHVFNGRMSLTKDTYSLAIARLGVNRIASLLGWKDIKLERFNKRESIVRANTRCWFSDDGKYVYYKIRSITAREYSGWVYNFECDTHTYMCHHLPVHNCDPINQDQANSKSLFSFFVFDLVTDDIVAEYTGRKQLAEEAFELIRLAALFWDATIMYESNSKMLFAYFAKMRCTWMLADCPEYLRSRGVVKYSLFGSSAKGISSSAGTIMTGNEQIKDWLLKTYPVEVKDEKGEPHIEYVPQLYRLRNRALLEELVGYAPEVNTDRVSAMQQLMMYREHFIILYGGAVSNVADEKDSSDDEFFDRDWKRYTAKHFSEDYHSTLNL